VFADRSDGDIRRAGNQIFYNLNAAHQQHGEVARIFRLARCVTL